MRTSVEIPDPLLNEARELARARNLTLRSLIERGLRKVVEEENSNVQRARFKLKNITYGKNGLHPEFQGASWEKLRDEIYGGR